MAELGHSAWLRLHSASAGITGPRDGTASGTWHSGKEGILGSLLELVWLFH